MGDVAKDARGAAVEAVVDTPIDQGVERFLSVLRTAAAATNAGDIASMRKAAVEARLLARAGENIASTFPQPDSMSLPAASSELSALVFTSKSSHGLIVYFHGGGWSLLNPETHAPIMQRLASGAEATVVGPTIPLAPEVPFPDLLSVCVDIVEAIRLNPETKARCAEGLILAGDSSGANLALATALSLRDAGKALPDGLILAYGVLDCDLTRSSYERYSTPDYPLSTERMDLFWSLYCRDEADRSHILASPLRSELHDLPPTRVIIAEQDVLRDENVHLVEKMRSAGVRVSEERISAATHAFWEACLHSKLSAASIDAAGIWARQIFRTGKTINEART